MASTSGVAEAATRSLLMSIRRSIIHNSSMYVKELRCEPGLTSGLRFAAFFLPLQFFLELPLLEIDIGDVACVIDERIRAAALQFCVLLFQIVERTVRTQEHVTG